MRCRSHVITSRNTEYRLTRVRVNTDRSEKNRNGSVDDARDRVHNIHDINAVYGHRVGFLDAVEAELLLLLLSSRRNVRVADVIGETGPGAGSTRARALYIIRSLSQIRF